MWVIEKKSQYVRFYAMQSIVFGGLCFIASIAYRIVMEFLHLIPFLGNLIGAVLSIAWMVVSLGILVVWVLQIIKAFSGVEWEIPYLGRIARQQMAKFGGPGDSAV